MKTKKIKLQINLPTEGVLISGQEYFDFLLFKANIMKSENGTDIVNVIKAKLGSMRFDTLDSIKQQLPVIVQLLEMIEEVVIEDQPLMKTHVPDDTHGAPRVVAVSKEAVVVDENDFENPIR